MIGWLAWVGSAFVLVSILLDDRRAFRTTNLIAAVLLLVAAAGLQSASMAIVDLALLAIAATNLFVQRPAPRRLIHIVPSDATDRVNGLRAV